MGSTSIRAALHAYLKEPAIPGLTVVYRGMPVRTDNADWPVGEDGAGAYAFLHIADRAERRIALGGGPGPLGGAPAGGIKKVVYDVLLVVQYRWQYQEYGAENQTDGWVEPWDAICDGIVERLRADRTAGAVDGAPVWQVGEGDGDGADDDIRIQTDAPVEDSGQVVLWAQAEFKVVEMVNT